MKKISDILKNIKYTYKIIGTKSKKINDLCSDSRIIKNNNIFIALQGDTFNGNVFVNHAIKNGAVCIICEKEPKILCYNITYIIMNNVKKIVYKLCKNFYNNIKKIKIIGVTGTNGKTTIATLLYNLFNACKYKCMLLSTIQIIINKKKIPSNMTTPNIIDIYKYLNLAIKKKCYYAFMEISSHAIEQKRIEGLKFKMIIFSNISHDHLDYHNNFKTYIKTKIKLFKNLNKNTLAIINSDDKNTKNIIHNCRAQIKTYGIKKPSNYNLDIIKKNQKGSLIKINNKILFTKFITDFNMYNLLAVYSTAVELKIDKNDIYNNIKKLKSIEGRFEVIKFTKKINLNIIIDYAHNPQALKTIFKNIKNIYHNINIICVLGCGGDRDYKKRPIMTNIAYKKSKILILTSDNPRFENEKKIIQDMIKGINNIDHKKLFIIYNRKLAIKTAINISKNKDIILIAGKGHEKFQEIKGKRIKFNDKEIAKYYIQKKIKDTNASI